MKGGSKRLALLVAVVLVAGSGSPARGEWLFTELSARYHSTDGFASGLSNLRWYLYWPIYSPEQYVNWTVGPEYIGTTQRTEFAPNHFLNSSYRSSDFTYENPLPISHGFALERTIINSDGPTVTGWSVLPQNFFISDDYGEAMNRDFGSYSSMKSPLHLTSHFTPPNGNSFVGTNYRFTAVEFTVNDYDTFRWVFPPDNSAPFLEGSHMLDFTVRFYGVPEPGTLTLIILCVAIFPLVTGRTARPR